MQVYLEIGQKRIFAGAIEWPGWCRSSRTADEALAALAAYGQRYAKILAKTGLGYEAPGSVDDFVVVERLEGNATTDFGAPDAVPQYDAQPLDAAGRERARTILEATWRALDEAVDNATGKELRKGPRGGGRDAEAILRHLLGADASYLGRLAHRLAADPGSPLREELQRTRTAILDALAAAERGDVPAQGPRGGKLWTARFFIRRLTWHVTDHLWEIEDRTGN